MLVLVPQETLLLLKKLFATLLEVGAADLHNAPQVRHQRVLPTANLAVMVHIIDEARARIRMARPTWGQGALQTHLCKPAKLGILIRVDSQLLCEGGDRVGGVWQHAVLSNDPHCPAARRTIAGC
jgi:hypothetical protein